MTILFRPKFWADLEDGVAYLTRNASGDVALRWHAEVMAAVRLITHRPDLGRPRHDLKPMNVRSVVLRRFPKYLLFYSWDGSSLEVLRVKHGMMDLPKLFDDENQF